MEIGGRNCHLCGEKMESVGTLLEYKKKVHHKITKRYACGTIVHKEWKSVGEGHEMENLKQTVQLGENCLDVS